MAVLDHTLVIQDDGARVTDHPEYDRDGCTFDAYVASDWMNPGLGAGTWKFTWMPATDEVPLPYWNGTFFG